MQMMLVNMCNSECVNYVITTIWPGLGGHAPPWQIHSAYASLQSYMATSNYIIL